MAIDWARRPTHHRHKSNNFSIITYPDAPGEYFDEAGNRVSDELAREANLNVDEERIERDKRLAIAKAREDAEAEAARKIAAIRAEVSPTDVTRSLLTERQTDGLYRIRDLHGNLLKESVTFDEAFAAIAQAHGFNEPALQARRTALEPELKNDKPSGKFKVVTLGGDTVGSKLSREEAEELALKQIGG
jgi:hypothetical protein